MADLSLLMMPVTIRARWYADLLLGALVFLVRHDLPTPNWLVGFVIRVSYTIKVGA